MTVGPLGQVRRTARALVVLAGYLISRYRFNDCLDVTVISLAEARHLGDLNLKARRWPDSITSCGRRGRTRTPRGPRIQDESRTRFQYRQT